MSPSPEHQAPVVGLIADTHCKEPDGSDLPDTAVDALAGCDLIVHLGDLVSTGVLDRLERTGAEVLAIRNPTVDPDPGTDRRLLDGPVHRELAGWRLALLRELPAGGPETSDTGDGPVDVVAYGVPAGGGGHDHRVAMARGILTVTPGSPNLPVRHGTVARLVFGPDIEVEIVRVT